MLDMQSLRCGLLISKASQHQLSNQTFSLL